LFVFLKVAFKLSFVHVGAQKMLHGDFIYPDIMGGRYPLIRIKTHYHLSDDSKRYRRH